jgi:hypothetical protein
MTAPDHRRIRTAGGLAGLAVAFALVGCNGLLDTQRESYTTARVQVTGTSPVPLLLTTSDQFQTVQDPGTGFITTQMLSADTTIIGTLPFDSTVSLGQFNQFLLRLINPDTARTADIRLIIRLDDKKEAYNVGAKVTGAYLQYTYYQY